MSLAKRKCPSRPWSRRRSQAAQGERAPRRTPPLSKGRRPPHSLAPPPPPPSCKTCRDKIEKAAVRVGVEVTHPQYGVSNQWHHASCFDFSAKQVPDIQGIAGFDGLAPNQQAELEGLAGNKGKGKAAAPPKAAAAAAADVVDLAGSPSSAKKAKKERKKHPTQLDEEGPIERGVARIEYATAKKPSNCKACDGKIQNGEPRVGVTYPSPFYEGLSVRERPSAFSLSLFPSRLRTRCFCSVLNR